MKDGTNIIGLLFFELLFLAFRIMFVVSRLVQHSTRCMPWTCECCTHRIASLAHT